MAEKEFYSIDDFAKMTGVSAKTIYNNRYLKKDGNYPKFIKIGGKLVTTKKAVAEFVERQMQA